MRDGRYAMHGFPPAQNEDAIYITGRAELRTDERLRDALAAQFFEERGISEQPPGFDQERLFEFLIDGCLLTRTTGHGDYDPQHTIWRATPG